MAWSRIVFKTDGQSHQTPISFFNEHQKVMEELRQNKIRDVYEVFWSPDPNETPEKFIKKGNKIINQDLILTTLDSKGHLKPQSKTGWYHATLEQWDESEDALCQLLDEPKGRRAIQGVKIPPPKPELEGTKLKRENRKLRESGRQNNMKKAVTNVKETSKSKDNKDTEDHSSAFDDEFEKSDSDLGEVQETVPLSKYRAVLAEVKELRARVKKLEAQREKLLDDNFELRDTMRGMKSSRKRHRSSPPKTSRSSDNTPLAKKTIVNPPLSTQSQEDTSGSTTSLNQDVPQTASPLQKTPVAQKIPPIHPRNVLQEMTSSSSTTVIDQNTISIALSPSLEGNKDEIGEMPNMEVLYTESIMENSENQLVVSQPSSTKISKKKGQGSSKNCGGIQISPTDFNVQPPPGVPAITFEQFVNNATSVAAGKEGDSQFVNNICGVLWDDIPLAQRSVHGYQCPSDPTIKPKLPCTPAKLKYIYELSAKRIDCEIFPVSEEEKKNRKKKEAIHKHISQKIKTVRRYCRSKKNSL